jgi:6-pyruvoyltetrahydropterin/6-carboxytetrahydropterin synthase
MPDGIVWDTGRALDLLKTVLAEFDYRDLDELAEFRGCNTAQLGRGPSWVKA